MLARLKTNVVISNQGNMSRRGVILEHIYFLRLYQRDKTSNIYFHVPINSCSKTRPTQCQNTTGIYAVCAWDTRVSSSRFVYEAGPALPVTCVSYILYESSVAPGIPLGLPTIVGSPWRNVKIFTRIQNLLCFFFGFHVNRYNFFLASPVTRCTCFWLSK